MSALVTGASGGLGRVVALVLAEHGHDVGVHYRGDADGAAAAVADIRQPDAVPSPCTPTSPSTTPPRWMPRATTCSTAAPPRWAPRRRRAQRFPQGHLAWDALDTAAWDAFHRAGLRPTTALLHRAAARLGEGGVIVVVGSIEGLRPAPTHTPYAVAKAALHHLTAAAAAQLGARGIRVVAVAPGLVDREGLAQAWPEGVERYRRASALGGR